MRLRRCSCRTRCARSTCRASWRSSTPPTAAEVTLGVLPIESSLVGPIAETHDLLFRAPLSIVREATLPIRHCIVGLAGASFDDARIVLSHPAAFDQCRDLLGARDVRRIPSATTADAAREVADAGDPRQVAIASAEAAAAYGLEVLADDVGDRPGAFTRFVALAPYTQVGGGEGWRTALSFVTDHQPGALVPGARPARRGTASTWCSSSHGRSRTRRGATVSTWCSTAMSTTNTSARR